MAGGGTPRQQMIGMMYLVLLAMLAMNASKDLLNAFVMLEQGIDKTVNNFAKANSTFYTTIEKAAASSPAYKKVLDQALEVQKKANEVCTLIANDKVKLVTQGAIETAADTVNGAIKPFLDDKGIPLNKDNQDQGAGYYVAGEGPSENGLAIKEAIDEFRDLVVKTLNEDGDPDNDYLVTRYTELFDTKDMPDPHDETVIACFASRLSEHLPLASVTANLSLYQSYIRNAEADVVGSIASKMDGSGMVVDKSQGLVQFESGYVLKGDSVRGKIFLAAYNSKSKSTIYVGQVDTNIFGGSDQKQYPPGQKAPVPMVGEYATYETSGGSAFWKQLANETGSKVVTGVIKNSSSKGTFFTKFKQSYMVAEPTATIAATKMNVFYVGVPNPVQISAPGVTLDELEISGAGLSFRPDPKVGGGYIVTARKANNRGTDVVVKKKGAGVLGKSKFRVKRLPDPAASLLGKKEGLISRGKLKAASFLKAEMENFDFDVKVRVASFTMTVNMGGDLVEIPGKGAKLNAKMKTMLTKVKKGSRVYFENVKVKMPDGSIRKLASVVLKVQ